MFEGTFIQVGSVISSLLPFPDCLHIYRFLLFIEGNFEAEINYTSNRRYKWKELCCPPIKGQRCQFAIISDRAFECYTSPQY